MAFQPNQYQDLLNTTFPSRERVTWSDQAQTLQNFHVMGRILAGNNVKQRSGKEIQFNVRFWSADQAEMVAIRQRANPASKDLFALGTAPWRQARVPCLYDEEIIDMNSGADEQLVDYLVGIRTDAQFSLAATLETQFFQGPTSLSDNLSAYGLPVWVPKGSGTSFSFENTDPTYVSGGAGGFASATYATWRSGFSQYVNIDDNDLYKKMRIGLLDTGWDPPVPGPYSNMEYEKTRAGFYTPGYPDREMFTVRDVVLTMEQQARTQNDNLGPDLNMYAGKVHFNQIPITYTAWLTQNAGSSANSALHGIDPIYCVDWRTWEVSVLKGNLFKKKTAEPHPDFPRTWVEWTFVVWNFVCNSRRSNFLLSKANT